MDKKNTVIGVLLLAAAFIALQLTPKRVPPPKAIETGVDSAVSSTTTPADSLSTTTPAVGVAPTSGTDAATMVASTATVAVIPGEATITALSNEHVQVNLTNFGGAIRDVALKKYPAIQGQPEPFVFNAVHADPMLAFVGQPGIDRNAMFQVVSQTANEVVYRAVLNGNLEITRRYVLPSSEGPNTDPYQVRHETILRNLSDQALLPLKVSLALGTAGPATKLDDGRYTSTGHATGNKAAFISRSQFDRGVGFAGFGAHEPRGPLATVGSFNWLSVENQFFVSIFTPTAPASGLITSRIKVRESRLEDRNENNAYAIAGTAQMDLPAIPAQGEAKIAGDFYVGPKEYRRLANHDVFKAKQDEVMQFGFFGFFSQLLNTIMIWMHGAVGNWGMAIVLTTLTLKIATLPLTLKASKSMKRMQKLAPEMKLIREKFKDNPQKQQVAMMELYKAHKVNPLGGCIPMLLPLPFFFGFYQMLQGTPELRFAHFLWAPDLSLPDTVATIAGLPLNIFPLLLGVTMIVQMQLTPQVNMDKAQATMMKFTPVIFLTFCYNFSCALALYSTVNGLFTIGQQVIINRMKDDVVPVTAPNDRLKNVTPGKKKKV